MSAWPVVFLVALAAAVLGILRSRRARVLSRDLNNLAAESDGEYLA